LLVLDIGAGQGNAADGAKLTSLKGDLKQVAFTLDRASFDAAADGAPLSVHYRKGTGDSWDFGALDKSQLDR
jgi:hypothetical protein